MSSKYQILPQSLANSLLTFSEYKQSEALSQLLALSVPQANVPILNEQLEMCINSAFKNLVEQDHASDFCSFFVVVVKGRENTHIGAGAVLGFLQNVFQCVSIDFLSKIVLQMMNLSKELEEIGRIGTMTNRMHRILIQGLKKLPYYHPTQRGFLHLLLSKILPFAHESGLQPKQMIIMPEIRDETIKNINYSGDLNKFREFYENYCELVHSISMSEKQEENRILDICFEKKNNQKEEWSNTEEKQKCNVLISHINKISNVVSKIIEYFKTKQGVTKEYLCLDEFDLDMRPIAQFLASNEDSQIFREILLLQVKIYLIGFKEKLKLNEVNDVLLNQTIEIFNHMINQYLLKEGELVESTKTLSRISKLNIVEKLLLTEIEWSRLKAYPKQTKKQFVKCPNYKVIKGLKTGHNNAEKKKEANDLIQNSWKVFKKEIQEKVGITEVNIEQFLKKRKSPMQKQASLASFSCYIGQALRSLESYNYSDNIQTHFSERTIYNIYEWKAFRSLFRQSSKQLICLGANESKTLKDYRLLQWISKKYVDLQFNSCTKNETLTEETDQE